jgi:tetratricopeptide (TPR) repeat protein
MTEEAVCAYNRSLRMNANDAASLSGLGWLYNRMGKNHEIALLFCRHSVDLSPAHGLYRYRLGKLYLKENRLDEARRQFEKAVALGHDATGELESVRNRSTHKAS